MNVYKVLLDYEEFAKMCKELNKHERLHSEGVLL